MKIKELYAVRPEAVVPGLCVKGLKTGVVGVIISPFDDDFDASVHFFYEDGRSNGYGHFNYHNFECEVLLDSNGYPVYQDIPSITFE